MAETLEEKINVLNSWNPWWSTPKMPPSFKGIQRDVDSLLFKTLEEREITVLTGVRRCGKTTIMYQMMDNLLQSYRPDQIFYMNLEDPLLSKQSLEDIYSVYKQHRNPSEKAFVFLDEVQIIPEWERVVKKHYELKENVKFIVSGSSANLVRGDYATLLTGRTFTFTIFPLSFKECLKFNGLDYTSVDTETKKEIFNSLSQYLNFGGFPEVYFKDTELKIPLLKEYFDTIIWKDVIKRRQLNPKNIMDLAVYLLTNVGNLYSVKKIHDNIGLPSEIIRDGIASLSESYLIFPLSQFSYSVKETIRQVSKNYVIDCGLRNAAGFRFSGDVGRLVENAVVMKMVKDKKSVYYWKNGGEVDAIIKNDASDFSLTAINVHYTDEIDAREIPSLELCKKHFGKQVKKLVLLTKDTEKEDNGISYIPVWKYLLDLVPEF